MASNIEMYLKNIVGDSAELPDTPKSRNEEYLARIIEMIENGDIGGGGSSITVDNYLSSSSTNPVQNKVITDKLKNLNDQKWDAAKVSTAEGTVNDDFVPTCGAVNRKIFNQGFYHIYASSSTVQAIIAQMGASADVVTPSTLSDAMTFLSSEYSCPYNMLCWQNGYTLELARIFASIDLTTQKATAYVRGRTSIAYGIIGEDDSWTVEAL